MTNRHIKILAVLVAAVWTPVIGFGPVFIVGLLFLGAWCIATGIAQISRYGINGEETLEADQFERSARWVGNGQLTLEDHELLVGYALEGRGKIPTNLVAARKLALSIKDPNWLAGPPAEPGEQMTLARKHTSVNPLPRLPIGYFDGWLSADEPEDSTDWAEIRRGDGTTYWLRERW